MTTKPERCQDLFKDGVTQFQCELPRCHKGPHEGFGSEWWTVEPSAQGEPSTASGPTLGTCDKQPAFEHPQTEDCKNWKPVQPLSTQDETAEQCDANYALNRAVTDLAAAEKELERLREALRLVLPKLAHKPECMTCLPASEWEKQGSWVADKCCCEIAIAEAALGEAQKG